MGNLENNRLFSHLSSNLFSNNFFPRITEFTLRGSGNHADPLLGINSHGFRSSEFKSGTEILALGCSQTYGDSYQTTEFLWPTLLGDKTNMSYANLGIPGGSIQQIVETCIAYIRDYGKPKAVVALLPGINRLSIPIRVDINAAYINSKKSDIADNLGYGTVFYPAEPGDNGFKQDLPVLSRRPHLITDVLPEEVALGYSMTALNYLIEYCKIGEIPLAFSSWHEVAYELLLIKLKRSDSKLDMSGFMEVDPGVTKTEPFGKCHEPEFDSYRDNWDHAPDKTHMGIHAHIHYAEAFAEKINQLIKD